MTVVPSGRVTKEGKIIYKAAPTETDVRREAAEKRVQKFGPGGKKISDTSRVEVTVQGKRKFVTLEKAKELGTKEEKEEARTKIKRREKLERTIKARFEREIEEARAETEKKKKAIKLVEVEKKRVEKEVIKPKRPLELFSEAAQEKLGLTETPEGLLEVRKGKRKIVVTGKKEVTEIPISAEFRTGFERQVGTGKPTFTGLIGLTALREKVKPTAEKVFGKSIDFFKGEELKVRRKLRGRPSIIEEGQLKKIGLQEARTIQLRAGQFLLGGEIEARKELVEKPFKTPAFFAISAIVGGVTRFVPTKVLTGKVVKMGSKVLGGLFVTVTGVETGLEVRRGDIAGAGGVLAKRSIEAVSIIGGFKVGAAVVGKGITTTKRIKFERKVTKFQKRIPKFTPKELETRLRVGGIETGKPGEIQTTFGERLEVISRERAVRIRVFEKAKRPLKRPTPPSRIAIIQTDPLDVTDIPPKLVVLEKPGRLDVSKFGKVPKEFTGIRLRLARVGEIKIRDTGIQKVLAEPKLEIGRFRTLPKPPKFKTTISKVTKFEGPPAKTGLNMKVIGEKQARLKLIKQIEKFSGKPGKLTPEEFARQKGFLFVEQPGEPPRIDITKFAGKEISQIKPPKVSKLVAPKTLTNILVGTRGVARVKVGEDVDIISGQKLRKRLKTSLRSRQNLISDLEKITGTKPKTTLDVISGLEEIQEVEPIQRQEQLLITLPRPRVPERGKPEVPPPEFIRPHLELLT